VPFVNEDDFGDNDAAPRRRTSKAKPKAKRTRRDLLWDPANPRPTSTTEFLDPDMQSLYDRGYFDTFIGELKGGKEATVFLVGRGDERFAAKVYTDIAVRTFRNDDVYWSGFYVADARISKAMKQHSARGQRARQGIWVNREYHYLWRLFEAGLPVPRPAIGPGPSDLAEAGSVVLMEFIGAGDVPASRLSDVRLEPDAAKEAYSQSVELARSLSRLGLVHGDLSTYNLLWHRERVWLIDVPQVVELSVGRAAVELVQRDAGSLVTSFRRLGVQADAHELARDLLAHGRR
jgi:RIO kinase 1